MCTLTYIPNESGYLLTSSRDEGAARQPALPPVLYDHEGQMVLYPKDPDGGGTWIVLSEKGVTWCLLNGGQVPHQYRPPYTRSRGQVVLEATAYVSLFDFMSAANLSGVEPFTLVQIRLGHVEQLIWDGAQMYWEEKDAQQRLIWSSVSLYSASSRLQRLEWFNQWLDKYPIPQRNDMLNFHRNAGNGDSYNDIQMNRAGLIYTHSITSVLVDGENEKDMLYIDLISAQQYSSSIGLSKA